MDLLIILVSVHKLLFSEKVVISGLPARSRFGEGRRKPESRVHAENRDPVFEMVPDFRRDDVWMPDQIRHDGLTDFVDTLYLTF